MANPSNRWDKVPVYGVFHRAPDDTPELGTVELTLAHRITRVDGRVIYPAGAKVSAVIGDQAQQNSTVRSAVRAAWRAADEAAAGGGFDGVAWDTWWDDVVVPAAIFTAFPALDDPDIVSDPDNRVMIKEALISASGREYAIQPLLTHLDLPIPGINLGTIEVPPGSPVVPAPVYAKGIPGGVAALDADGDVVDAAGEKVGAGLDEAALGTYLTTNQYATDADVTAATSGLVPSTRTVAGKALSGNVTLVAADVSDSTATGRSVVTATDAAAARSAIGAGTSSLALGTTSSTAKAGDYQPTAANISNATTVGRNVLTAVDAATARTAIGAGTSNLALGTTSSTAKAGDYAPNAAAITDSTTVGRAVVTAADAAAARTAIGAGTSSLALGTTSSTAKAGDYQPTAANISDSTATGRSVLTAASAAAARTAIGAGTSSVAIGTTSGTAADAAAVTTSLAGKTATLAIGTAVTSQRIVIVPTAGEYTGGQAGDIVLVLSV